MQSIGTRPSAFPALPVSTAALGDEEEEEDSEDEEADRNLPLLSQYMQPAAASGRSPAAGLRHQQQQQYQQQEGGDASPPGVRRNTPISGAAAAAAAATVLSPPGASGPRHGSGSGGSSLRGRGSSLLTADPAMLGELVLVVSLACLQSSQKSLPRHQEAVITYVLADNLPLQSPTCRPIWQRRTAVPPASPAASTTGRQSASQSKASWRSVAFRCVLFPAAACVLCLVTAGCRIRQCVCVLCAVSKAHHCRPPCPASGCWLLSLQGKNLVYCAPTSGGKSLVAEVLMLRRVVATGRPAMLVLPFVSICSEKSEHLRCAPCRAGQCPAAYPGGQTAPMGGRRARGRRSERQWCLASRRPPARQ